MGNEIQKTEAGILEIIARAATDKDIDVSKMESLLNFQLRILDKEAEIELQKALAKLQPKIQALKKSKAGAKTNQGAVKFYYTPYEDIDAMLRKPLQECGLALSFSTRSVDGKPWFVLRTTEITRGGFIETMIPYAPDTNSQLNGPQQVASGTSYAKRQCVILMFNLVTEGADDNAGFAGAISVEQIGKIERLISECGVDREAFGKYLESQFGTNEIPLIPAAGFAEVESKLLQKKKQK